MATYGGKSNEDVDWEGEYTKYYSEDGSCEIIRNNITGLEKHVLFIGDSPYQSQVVYLKEFEENNGSYLFLHKDYIGSILAISDESGAVIEECHFDAWGNLTHGSFTILGRGYTSHEHLETVGLIHMNGRLYDSILRRFLNADDNLQDSFNSQNYNRYAYALNNPLMFNDPSGEFFFGLIALTAFLKAILIGAAVGLAAYTVGLAVTGNIGLWNFGGAFKAVLFGAISGAATFQIGTLFQAGTNTLGTTLLHAVAHGVSQGVLGLVQGQKFLSSAVAAIMGSLGATVWGKFMKEIHLDQLAQNVYGTIAFGAISGGIGSEFSGGNFWQGTIIGGIVAGLNHVLHQLMPVDDELKKLTPEQRKELDQIKSGSALTVEQLKDTGLDKVLDKWIAKTILGKVFKVSITDYIEMGGQIYYDHKLYSYEGINKNEMHFRFTMVTSKTLISGFFSSASEIYIGDLLATYIGAELGGLAASSAAGWIGVGIGFYIDQTYVKGIKYFDQKMRDIDTYIVNQTIGNILNSRK
ncbi:hypothetical protein JML65_00015 [Chryseobacterium sp. KMC2]|nr:hypothetical protein [Chryseobacterium sp. KMC2]